MLGALLKWLINGWLYVTGKVLTYSDNPWLQGPMSDNEIVGDQFYNHFAGREGLVVSASSDGGLLDNFSEVMSPDDPLAGNLNPRIRHFYEHTGQYKLEVWSQWYSPISFFARILIRSVSTKMDQLNIPLDPLETSRGMSNQVLQLKNPATGKLKYACWLRKSILSGRVVYAGFYSACTSKGLPYVKVVFPLPGGNVTVLLHVVVQPDGSVKLLSDGKKIGDSGYYRVARHNNESVKVRYIPLKESIHVFEDEEGVLRTDHQFSFFSMKFLHLHYRINPVK